MPNTAPAYTFGGITRPALIFDNAGNIILTPEAAAFQAAYGTKALYAGLPANTPFPPVAPTLSAPADNNGGVNSVLENAAVGAQVGITVQATNVGGPPVTYSLTDNAGGRFQINANTGVVTVAAALDYETAPGHAYNITVQATDGILSSSQTFTIGVGNVAPSTPLDGNAAANSVAEGAAVGTAVGITASSTDVNGPGVTWSLSADSSGGGFAINPTTGVVTVANSSLIDYESSPGHAYTITAVASDGTATSSQTFTIGVSDVVPSSPTDNNSATNSIAEGAANGSTVGVTASSVDPNGPASTYSLTDNAGGRFAINSTTGVVTVANGAAIDFETAPGQAYSITVQATSGALSTTQTFSIGVSDVAPQAPNDSNGAANTVFEGVANGTVVGITAASTDPGGGPAPTYSLTDSAGGRFTINSTTGVVTVANGAAIDFETATGQAYNITVQSTAGALSTTQNFSIGVGNVNEAPAGTDKAVLIAEDTTYTFGLADFGFSDPSDSIAPNSLLAVTMATVPGAGTLTNNGVTVNAGDTVLATAIAAGHLVFTPVLDGNGSPLATFTFQVQDNGGTANGGVNLDQSANTFTINVNAGNDAPINSVPGTQGVNEQATLTFSTGNGNAITISDVDIGSGDETVTLTVTSGTLALGSTAGLTGFTNNAASITLTGTVANVNAALNGLTYTGNLNFNGADSLVVSTNDNGNTGTGGPQNDTDSITINVAAVNDAPVNGVPGAQTVNEDTNLVFSGANAITISDVDGGSGDQTVTLTVASGTLALGSTLNLTSFTNNAASITLTGTIANINAALDGLTYHGNLNFNGADSLSIVTHDNGNTGGGDLTDSDSVTINVTAVNDAPSFTVGWTPTVLEDSGAHTVNGFITGISAGPANEAGQTVNFLTSNDNNALFTVQPTIDASGNLAYTLAGSATGGAIVTVQIHDNGGSANGGSDTSGSQTFTISSGPVNDAPAGADNTFTMLEDGARSFTAADFGFTDPVDAAITSGANVFQAVIITTVPGAAGTLTLDTGGGPVAVTAGQSIPVAQIGGLVFTLAANANGPASFTFQVQDNGGTANAGVDTDQSANTIAFDVTAVNDAPAGTDTTISSIGPHTFTAAEFGFTDPVDAASAGGANALQAVIITTIPAAGTGTLTLNDVAVTAGQSIAVADIGGLKFTPVLNNTGSFTFQVQDNGGLTNSGVDTDQSPNNFTITQNVAPTITAGDTLNYIENATSVIDPTIAITDTDNPNMTGAKVTITTGFDNTQDVLSFTPVGAITGLYDPFTGVLTLSGTDTQANYELALESVTYNNTSDNPSTAQRTLSYTVNDGSVDSAAATATINVGAVNDAPVITPTGGSTAYVENAAAAVIDGALTVTDPDSAIASAQVRVSVGFQTGDSLNFVDQNGITGVYTPGTGVLALSGTASVADYQAALRSITFSSTNNDPGVSKTIEFKVNDATVDSNLATRTLAVTPVNDEPTLTATANGAGAVTFTETSTPNFPGSGPVDLFSSPSTSTGEAGQTVTQVVLTVTNVADTTEYLTIGATAVDLVHGNLEVVNVGGAAGMATVSIVDGTATITVTPNPTFTAAQVNTLVDNLAYSNDDNTPTATTHTISVTSLTDSGANGGGDDNTGSPSVSTIVTVVATNDGPVAVNDTFTGLNGAITNTTLVVNGPAPGTADPVGVQKTITGNILANDTDVDGGPLAVVTGTFATAQGGTVTLHADGGFIYVPTPNTDGTVDTSDSFTYTVTDGNSAGDNGTATGTVTINFVPNSTIWYVDSSYAGANGASDGSSLRPFTDFTQLNGAGGAGDVDAAGDTIFVYDGTYTGNLELEGSQKLFGERHGLDAPDGGGGAGVTTLLAANAGAGLTQINGTITASSDNSIQAISWGSSAGVSLTGTNVGNLHVNDANAASAGSINNTTGGAVSINGSTALMNVQFTSLSSGGGASGISLTNALGTFNATGGTLSGHTSSEVSISGGTGTITYAGTIGNGSGDSASITGRTGGTVTMSGNINDSNDTGGGIGISNNANTTINFTGTTKTLNTGIGDGVSMSNNTGTSNVNFTGGGLDIDTTAGTGFAASGAGTYTVTGLGNTINTTGSGTALNLAFVTVGAGGITFDSASTTGAANGILLDTVGQAAGSSGIDINGGSIANATARGVDINATSADISIASSISTTAAGRSVEVTGTTGNKTITFSGAIDDNGLGVNLANNTGTTINFTGGLDIDTSGNNTGFSATGGGTVSATQNNTSIVNSINSGQGTALNVSNTNIGASDLTFRNLTSNGGSATGIILDTTGSAGGLHVVGTGSAGSGGTIANKTGADGSTSTGIGIYLNNTSEAEFAWMQLNGLQNFGIRGNNVTGFKFDNSVISGTNGTAAGVFDEAAISFNNLLGSASISNSNIGNGFEYVLKVLNNSGTLNRLTIDNTDFGTNDTTLGGDAVQFVASNTATANITVINSGFTNAREDLFNAVATQTANMDVVFRSNTLSNNHTNKVSAASNILVFSTSTGNVTYDISHNASSTGATGSAIAVAKGVPDSGSGGTMTGTVNANTIGVAGVVGSGSEFTGIFASSLGSGTHTTAITNNVIRHYNEEGIFLKANDNLTGGNSVLNATVTGNITTEPDSFAFAGLWVVAGSGSGTENNVVNLVLGNSSTSSLQNDFTNGDPGGFTDVLLQESAVAGTAAINLSRAGSAAGTAAGVVQDDNIGMPAVSASGTVNLVNTLPPTPPPVAPLMAAMGGVQASTPTPGDTNLSQAELNSVVAAAIAQWAHAGASTAQLAALAAITFAVTDLAGNAVGEHSPGHIFIDTDAAGHGWFVDSTPSDNFEFAHAQNAAGTDLSADPASAAAGHLDLLTAVVHEMGHELGLAHSDDAHDVMADMLVDGERRLPDAADVPQANAGPIQAQANAQAPLLPVIRGTAGNDILDAGHGGFILVGLGGADTFLFANVEAHTSAPPPLTHVADYHFTEGDVFDFSALTASFHGSNMNDAFVVRAVEDASGTFATLQVNTANVSWGTKLGPTWTDVAQIDRAHAGDDVSVLIDNGTIHRAQIHVDLLV